MKATDIENIKKFTAAVFTGRVFDEWLVMEASFSTAVDISIDGHLNFNFFTEEEQNDPENLDGLAKWKNMKPLCFEIIKGKKVPLKFKIIFVLPSEKIMEFAAANNIKADNITGLYINVIFQDNKLYCTSGTAKSGFSLDNTLDHSWDDYVVKLIKYIESK